MRGITVQALRYTFAEGGDKFDHVLQTYLVSMLSTMLQDPNLDIRRLGLMTFTSAAHNKPELVLGHLNKLMPYIFAESTINPELVREVMMGPFKMMVDDGLELRKVRTQVLMYCFRIANVTEGCIRVIIRPHGGRTIEDQHHRFVRQGHCWSERR